MTYKELQTALKQYKTQGLTTIKLNSKQALLQEEYDRLILDSEWQNKAESTVNRLLNGEEMTINRGTPVNFLEIRDSDNKTQRPVMTQEALDTYVFNLYNPKLDKIMGCANPRFEEVTAKEVTTEPSKHFTVFKSRYRKGYYKVQIHDVNTTTYKRKQEWLLENLGCDWNSREGYLDEPKIKTPNYVVIKDTKFNPVPVPCPAVIQSTFKVIKTSPLVKSITWGKVN